MHDQPYIHGQNWRKERASMGIIFLKQEHYLFDNIGLNFTYLFFSSLGSTYKWEEEAPKVQQKLDFGEFWKSKS